MSHSEQALLFRRLVTSFADAGGFLEKERYHYAPEIQITSKKYLASAQILT